MEDFDVYVPFTGMLKFEVRARTHDEAVTLGMALAQGCLTRERLDETYTARLRDEGLVEAIPVEKEGT